MSALDRLIPTPRLLEIDHVDLATPPEPAWEAVRHGDLSRSPLARALFAIRELPERLAGRPVESSVRIDDFHSSIERPGFQVLLDDPPREVAAGAIGKVWKPEIPFVHVDGAEAFAAYAEPGEIKVAWALRVSPRGERDSRVELELRVDATDEGAWGKFRRYFRVIGPASRLIRRSLLSGLARELGTPEAREDERPLPGDDLLPDAVAQFTHGITMRATPEKIWPWLVQMGCRRAGFYSIDLLDNAGRRSAREIHPELQRIAVGDVLPATPEGEDGFEVLRIDAPRTLVLGGLFDAGAGRQVNFDRPRPERFTHMTWAFVLEPLDEGITRLHVRARAAFSRSGRLHAAWIGPAHHLMETAQLRNLAARAEGRLGHDDWRDVLAGLGGAAAIALGYLTPQRRAWRSRWGLDAETAARSHPGDDIVPDPLWGWTHGVEIEAPAEQVWPWVAQIGAGRGGFYSYQWLENLAGCGLENAERVHPEWEVREGDELFLHPKLAPLRVARVSPGHWFVARTPEEADAVDGGKPRVTVSWLFLVEPIVGERCRFISRYRCRCSNDLTTRIRFGPAWVEPIGFAMDRRMLLGVKERAERAARKAIRRVTQPT
jgi:hypothetical protein